MKSHWIRRNSGVGTAIVVTALIFGCTSLRERAQEYLDTGDYAKAASTYERILKKDPENPEARAGLKRARIGVIEKKLLAVRAARQAGQTDRSLDLLLEVVRDEKEWGISPGSKAGYTQNEETGYAVKTATAGIREATRQAQALRAESLLERYSVLMTGKHSQLKPTLSELISKTGKERCGRLRRPDLGKTPFYADFVAKYCAHWKIEAKRAARQSGRKNQALVRNSEITLKVKGLPRPAAARIRERLRAALKQTAWYGPSGEKTLRGELKGRFTHDHDKVEVSLLHEYTVEEPYIEQVERTKTRKVPYEATKKELDPDTGRYREIKYTAYRQEKYTVKEPVKRYRQVVKHFPYGAWKHVQDASLSIDGRVVLDGNPIHLALEKSLHEEDTAHSHDMPDIGLRPKSPNLTDKNRWVLEQVKPLGEKLRSELSELWSDLNCGGDGGGTPQQSGERVVRCLRQPHSEVPGYAETWYRAEFGLSSAEVNSRIGFGRS